MKTTRKEDYENGYQHGLDAFCDENSVADVIANWDKFSMTLSDDYKAYDRIRRGFFDGWLDGRDKEEGP